MAIWERTEGLAQHPFLGILPHTSQKNGRICSLSQRQRRIRLINSAEIGAIGFAAHALIILLPWPLVELDSYSTFRHLVAVLSHPSVYFARN